MVEGESYAVNLILVAFCSTCEVSRGIQGDGVCAVCGTALPPEQVTQVRQAVRKRRQAFKRRLSKLEDRMRNVITDPLTFPSRGVPLTPDEHLERVLQPAFAMFSAHHEAVAGILNQLTWDPDEPECITAFSRLIGELDAALASFAELRSAMPPLEWRAVHRELCRAMAEQVGGQIYFALTIAAPDFDAASALQAAGNRSFDRGARHAERISSLIARMRHAPTDGPFQADGSIDIAALAWSSSGATATSIANGAELVRQTLSDVSGVSTLRDEYAIVLLLVLGSGAQVIDHVVLSERTKQMRSILDAADAVGQWVVDPELLLERVQRGIDRIIAGVERFGREWRYGLPRHHIMETLTDVYRQLIEGPMRDLGGVVLVAARVSRGEVNATYEQAVIDGLKAGEVVDGLSRLDTPAGRPVEMLYRNASAHADVEVTATGIIATEREIIGGREIRRTSEPLSDAEFYEEVTTLQENLLALQLTILLWVWSHHDQGIAAAVASMRPTPAQATRILGLLGGLAGLKDVVGSLEGDHVTVTCRYSDDSERREVGTVTLVPGAFGIYRDAAFVTLSVAGLRPATYARSEFAILEAEEAPHKLTLIGLLTAKWLIESGYSWTERDQATYVTFPLTMVHFACMRLAGSTPVSTDNIRSAIESLCLVRSRLDEVVPASCRSPLTLQAVEQIDILMTALVGLAETRDDPRRAVESQQFARQGADTVEAMYEVQEEAKSLRDQSVS